MNVTRQNVLDMAKLSRLEIDDTEIDMFVRQFGDILEHMRILQDVPTEGVEPLYTPLTQNAYLRPDEAKIIRSHDEIMANAPETDGETFMVPRIV